MASALVTLLLLSWAGLALVSGYGYGAAYGWADGARHVRLAIPAFMFGTLAHAMTMFYFIGTGRAVKDAVAEAGLGTEWVQETRRIKMLTSGPATAAMGIIVVTSVLGGGVDTGAVSGWLHGALAMATLLIAGFATIREIGCIADTLKLMQRLDEAITGRQPSEGGA